MPRFRVLVLASLPLHRWEEVEAESGEEAKNKALEQARRFHDPRDWERVNEVVEITVDEVERIS